jgi:hypothetical protein
VNAQLWRSLLAGLACLLASATWAQDSGENTYRPLFPPETIEAASPEQARRMRATEERNRKAWEERQAKLRAASQSKANPARGQSAAPAPRARKKIYKWVDKNGRVHFGDAPQGSGAQEVEVRGAARIQGNPPPAPSLGGSQSDKD